MAFDYLLDRIHGAEFLSVPFRHVEIRDVFRPDHLRQILAAPEISPPRQACDADLFQALFAHGYKIIDFPGCITDRRAYMRWHAHKPVVHQVSSACSGFGMALRLMQPRTPVVAELLDFLAGRAFQEALARKFELELNDVVYDAGIQKYLDGYEISPHPDIRRKALTYMVNVNPGADCEDCDQHGLSGVLRRVPSRAAVLARASAAGPLLGAVELVSDDQEADGQQQPRRVLTRRHDVARRTSRLRPPRSPADPAVWELLATRVAGRCGAALGGLPSRTDRAALPAADGGSHRIPAACEAADAAARMAGEAAPIRSPCHRGPDVPQVVGLPGRRGGQAWAVRPRRSVPGDRRTP
jgi:hypothetical protein